MTQINYISSTAIPKPITPMEEQDFEQELSEQKRIKTIDAIIKEVDELPPNVEIEKKSTDLVRPGDITDAVDSTDLLEQLIETNLEKIAEKNEDRHRKQQSLEARQKIREEYHNKAKSFYEKQWRFCKNTPVGHSYHGLDINGYTVSVCEVCGKASTPSADYSKMSHDAYYIKLNMKEEGDIYNNNLIDSLARQMIKIDEEAGLIEWPEPDDFISPTKGWKGLWK